MERLQAIPLSRARTALGLVLDVKRRILEEPKRINMRDPGSCKLPSHGGPACGSVGCFSGWLGFASGNSLSWGSVVHLLGDVNYIFTNRYSDRFDYFNSGDGDACGSTAPGTRAHAQAVARRIDRFIKQNYDALRRRKLRRVDNHLEAVV